MWLTITVVHMLSAALWLTITVDLNKNIHINICADEKECEILYCEKKNPAVKYLIEKKYQ